MKIKESTIKIYLYIILELIKKSVDMDFILIKKRKKTLLLCFFYFLKKLLIVFLIILTVFEGKMSLESFCHCYVSQITLYPVF